MLKQQMKLAAQILIALVIPGSLQQCSDTNVNPVIRKNPPVLNLDGNGVKRKMHGQAFTFEASVYQDYEFTLGSTSSANIQVYWGDDQVTPYRIDSEYYPIAHTYRYGGSYPVRITGDVRNITSFSSYYGNAQFTDINFKALTNLREVVVGLTPAPSTIDLSHNRKLEKVSLGDLHELESVALPGTHNIWSIEIYGRSSINTREMDAVIDNIYKNTQAKKIRNGIFYLSNRWEDEDSPDMMVGPPSASAILKLKKLQDVYGWQITPALP
jgi:hypothetical protein